MALLQSKVVEMTKSGGMAEALAATEAKIVKVFREEREKMVKSGGGGGTCATTGLAEPGPVGAGAPLFSGLFRTLPDSQLQQLEEVARAESREQTWASLRLFILRLTQWRLITASARMSGLVRPRPAVL